MSSRSTSIKSAELVSGLGAVVLGMGLGLLVPAFMHRHALPVLMAGVLVHGAGMTLKYRLEARQGAPLWWERWLLLAAVAGGVAWRLSA